MHTTLLGSCGLRTAAQQHGRRGQVLGRPPEEWWCVGNTDFPFKQGLLTQGRARFKHGELLMMNFGAPNIIVALWFELD
jgi:hypothetical protein